MGSSVKKFAQGALVGGLVGGTVRLLNHQKHKMQRAANKIGSDAEKTLAQEQEESRKKRARLYETGGNANGEEVANVGLSGDTRGNIFGNK